ncbi:MAG: hypothetical protein K6C97_05400 [Treponema sp.]|nr:hypothetical protein [Treponema sp.]
MKALIISDKQEILDSLQTYLKDNNFDVIVYRWLLKALDNIEEIHPDIIFLSASEYPRHWKTLASFVKSGIGGNDVKLFLYNPEPLSEEEIKKAQELGVQDFINNLTDQELSKLGSNKIELSDTSEEEAVSSLLKSIDYELILTHPVTGKFVFGRAIYDPKKDDYECKLNLQDLELNQIIRYVSVFDKNENDIKSFSAHIIENTTESIILKANSYYGQEI